MAREKLGTPVLRDIDAIILSSLHNYFAGKEVTST